MILPAVIIIIWSLSIVFLLGLFLTNFTPLDLLTPLLSSCIGGLLEMTVIAVATDADKVVVITMLTLRMISSILVYPLIIRYWEPDDYSGNNIQANKNNLFGNCNILQVGKNQIIKLLNW